MRVRRNAAIAILGTVAILSHHIGTRAHAAEADPAARPPKHNPIPLAAKPVKPKHKTTEAAEPVSVFLDETSTWVLGPEPPGPVFDLSGTLQCVPFARTISGIAIFGDAWTWWDKAAGIYARGNHPEPGAVLSFPGIERMPLGHVAVVTQVLAPRKIMIDHANWPTAEARHGAISHAIQVVDVSSDNDWTSVRVQFGFAGPLGSVYPANGFIYGWSESGVAIARPRFSLDYALWSPVAPSWRMFNPIAYLWALPKAARAQAYAAAARAPYGMAAAKPGGARTTLVLGAIGQGLTGTTLIQTLGVNRLDVGVKSVAKLKLGPFQVR